MKCLIVEDDFTARKLMLVYLSKHAECDVAINGKEAVDAVRCALEEKDPYDLLCLDVSMPEMDGQEALKIIRQMEQEHGILLGHDSVKVIMTTAFDDKDHIMTAFNLGCESYIVKPVSKEKLFAEIEKLGLFEAAK